MKQKLKLCVVLRFLIFPWLPLPSPSRTYTLLCTAKYGSVSLMGQTKLTVVVGIGNLYS